MATHISLYSGTESHAGRNGIVPELDYSGLTRDWNSRAFYDFLPRGNRLTVAMGELYGNNGSSSLTRATLRVLVRGLALEKDEDLDGIEVELRRAFRRLCGAEFPGSLFIGSVDPVRRIFSYLTRNFEAAFLIRARSLAVHRLRGNGSSGSRSMDEGFHRGAAEIEPGDVFAGFAGGNSRGASFEYEVLDTVLKSAEERAGQLAHRLLSLGEDFAKAEHAASAGSVSVIRCIRPARHMVRALSASAGLVLA